MIVCLFLGGEEQSKSHLEEVLHSSANVLLQRPRKTAEGSTNQIPLFKTISQCTFNRNNQSKSSPLTLLLLQVDCSDHDSDGSHDLIGSFTTKVSELQKAAQGSPVSSLIIRMASIFSQLIRRHRTA